MGDGVFVVALPLLALRITDHPSSVALVAMFFYVPWLLFSVPIGALIDRVDRRHVDRVVALQRMRMHDEIADAGVGA